MNHLKDYSSGVSAFGETENRGEKGLRILVEYSEVQETLRRPRKIIKCFLMNRTRVKYFKYLGSIVNGNNSIEEEIKGRISLGNRAFHANQDLQK